MTAAGALDQLDQEIAAVQCSLPASPTTICKPAYRWQSAGLNEDQQGPEERSPRAKSRGSASPRSAMHRLNSPARLRVDAATSPPRSPRSVQALQDLPAWSTSPRGKIILPVEEMAHEFAPRPLSATRMQHETSGARLYKDAQGRAERLKERRQRLQAEQEVHVDMLQSSRRMCQAHARSFHKRQQELLDRKQALALTAQPRDLEDLKECRPPIISDRSRQMVRSIDDLQAWQMRKKATLAKLVAEKQEAEDLTLTFSPRILPRSRRLAIKAATRTSNWLETGELPPSLLPFRSLARFRPRTPKTPALQEEEAAGAALLSGTAPAGEIKRALAERGRRPTVRQLSAAGNARQRAQGRQSRHEPRYHSSPIHQAANGAG
ncbi:hypothetical protein WJX72_005318 [[Myrmecia] bisecta]|uniref:Uncharacterized protein n=1 Tax=[Myrmecia] bisecta TaxID=41462 RepID=A0AAW1Q1R1_9CHLO